MIIVVDDEDAIMIVVDRDPAWMIELAWSVSSLAERGHEREAFVVVVSLLLRCLGLSLVISLRFSCACVCSHITSFSFAVLSL